MADRAPLRARVLAGVLLITLAALVGFDLAATSAIRRYLYAQTDSQLENVLSLYRPPQVAFPLHSPPRVQFTPRTARISVNRSGGFNIIGPPLVLRPGLIDQYFVEFYSGKGPKLILGGNPDLKPRIPASLHRLAARQQPQTVPSSNGRAQLRLASMPIGGGALLVTTSLAGLAKIAGRLEMILIIGSSCAALLVGIGVALILRRGMRPIETMAIQADRITAGDLTDRVYQGGVRSEVGRLGAALNDMLARIETSVREREASQELTNRFFADASHELRTPLASLRANAELYQQGALTDHAQVDEAIRRIVIESQRMSALVDDMLRLARLDQHPGQQHEPVDLTALVTDCVEQARVADPRRSWLASVDADLEATGDADLLRRAVTNVLANVRTHTPDGTAATVSAARANGSIRIEVSDDGPGVPAGQLPRLFDRFYRGTTPSPRPGAGLGLAIVAATATAHNGTAVAALNCPHGLTVTLTLPSPRP
ncbi:MAG TPA: HAMP domain-containing sensor histidine kinase [Streptosporangiaceae bacterium]|nr:HAMP domain-containing sensor histidine kinase [Streptosporangiaceae bacterium]